MLRHRFEDDDITFFKLLMWLVAIVVFAAFCFNVAGCGDFDSPDEFPDDVSTEELTEYINMAPMNIKGEVQPHCWGNHYVTDNCRRCPECCVSDLWDGGDDRADVEDIFCTSDVCPGPDCPCVLDGVGVWWLNATLSMEEEEDTL